MTKSNNFGTWVSSKHIVFNFIRVVKSVRFRLISFSNHGSDQNIPFSSVRDVIFFFKYPIFTVIFVKFIYRYRKQTLLLTISILKIKNKASDHDFMNRTKLMRHAPNMLNGRRESVVCLSHSICHFLTNKYTYRFKPFIN